MNMLIDIDKLPPNLFGFAPEGLSPAEEKTSLGKTFIELKNIRDKLGLKCTLLPSFLTNSIMCLKITESDFKKLISEFGPKNYRHFILGDIYFIHLTI
jgi:hypothetical protein